MAKVFNVNGPCMPNLHYMVDLTRRLEAVRQMADAGKYFTINRARQYGKTTLLHALADYLSTSYVVISLDFQRMSFGDFTSEDAFVSGLAREINRKIRFAESIPDNVRKNLSSLASGPDKARRMAEIFDCFSDWCAQSEKPVILIIDEVDAATDNQVFLDFLAQLRSAYLDRTVISQKFPYLAHDQRHRICGKNSAERRVIPSYGFYQSYSTYLNEVILFNAAFAECECGRTHQPHIVFNEQFK